MSVENNIPNGWIETTLGELVIIYSGKTRPKTNGQYPIYGGNGILNYGDKYNQDKNTIVIGRVGAYCGNVFYEKNKFWLSDNALGIKNTDKSNIDFLYYKLKQMKLNNVAIGAAQPLLTQTLLRVLETTIPENIEEQKVIAKILTAFDDKIGLLQAQNKTLETTAQTIFKEWFGKYQIGDNLPEGWQVFELGMVALLSAGGDKPKNATNSKTISNNIPIYSNGITNEGLYGYTDKPKILEESITVSARGTIGFICIRFKPYVPIVRLISIIPFQKYLSNKYLFFWLKNQSISGFGTTQQQLTIPVFKKTKIIIPDYSLMNKYTTKVNSFYAKIQNNKAQIQILRKTRDTLLPKLMSGKIRVNKFKD